MDALDEIIDVLVKHGADPDIKNYLQTAAMVDSSAESDNEETDEGEDEECESEHQSAFDLTQLPPSVNFYSVSWTSGLNDLVITDF
jgi:hypothetical protein